MGKENRSVCVKSQHILWLQHAYIGTGVVTDSLRETHKGISIHFSPFSPLFFCNCLSVCRNEVKTVQSVEDQLNVVLRRGKYNCLWRSCSFDKISHLLQDFAHPEVLCKNRRFGHSVRFVSEVEACTETCFDQIRFLKRYFLWNSLPDVGQRRGPSCYQKWITSVGL